jgi:8-oxo-dGTP pyrophosphatase MutT (NUDIX family)
MIVRAPGAGFASGALVFPGGKVDAADREPPCLALCAAGTPLPEEEKARRAGAVRELFEECGVLLARQSGEGALIAEERLREIRPKWKAAVAAGSFHSHFAALCAQEGVALATDLLVPFAHWITPKSRPKRFDTYFYLAAMPPGQQAAHDGGEAVGSAWCDPAVMVRDTIAGSGSLMFPTWMNLAKLARSSSVAEALTRARSEPLVTVCPEFVERDGRVLLRIPPEAGYAITEMDASLLRRAG